MRRLILTPMMMLSLCWLICGCAHRQVCPADCCPPEELDYFADASLSPRGKITVNVAAVPDHAAVDAALKQPASSSRYILLRPEECQCRAAEHAVIADLVDMERELAEARSGRQARGKQAAAELSSELLALHAADLRNQAASAALEAYYRLAEAEAGRDALKDSLGEIRRSIENLRQLKARGLQVAADEGQFQRREMELLDQQAQLRLSIDQLNGQLKLLLGMQLTDEPLIWPAADLHVAVEPVDAETAAALGLATRADLAMLQTLLSKLDVESLPSARSALQQRDASLGSQAGGPASMQQILRPVSGQDELEIRLRQLTRVYEERRRFASEEISSAVETVHTRLRQVALAKDTLESHRRQLENLKEKRNIGQATPSELAAARLDVIRATRELDAQVMAWKIAQVKLKEAQGLLAFECGYGHCGHCVPDTLCVPFDSAPLIPPPVPTVDQTAPSATPPPTTH